MNKHYLKSVILFIILTIHTLNGQDNINLFQGGARSAGMANASVANRDLWANFHNQANLGFNEQKAIGFYFENRFFVENLATGSLALAFPTSRGSFFGSISYFGYELFHQSKIGAGYSHKVFPNHAFSIQFDLYNAYQTYELGNKGALSFELGMAGNLGENLSYGIHLLNPTNSQLNKIEIYNIPSVTSAGLRYEIKQLTASAEIEKNVYEALIYNLGIEYNLNNYILLRTGVSTGYSKYAFGVGFNFPNIQAGFSFAHHEILGYTPHFSLTYAFKKA